MAKKHKDKKINNGRHNNTQTNRQYNGQETKDKKINNVDTIIQTNRQYNGQETQTQKKKKRSTH